MNICFLGDSRSIHILRWVDYFVNKGHDVHLITFTPFKDTNNLTKNNKFHFYRVGNISVNTSGGNWQYLLLLFKVKQLIKEIKPDIVNAHYITSYGFVASLLGIKKLVLSAWGSDILVTPNKNLIYKYITKFSLRKAKLVTSDSEYMTKVIHKLTDRRVLTVPMGVEAQLCELERKENNKDITILSLRTIDKNCNIDIIVRAFANFSKKYSNSRLIITNDGSELDNIQMLVNDLNINDKVEFRGMVPRHELINLLLGSNIYVSIPTSDSTSVTLLEAMACGIIPIVSNIPSNCEWIRSNDNGVIVDSIEEKLLYNSFVQIIENKNLKQNCIIKNREIILERAVWNNNMLQVENEYLNLIITN